MKFCVPNLGKREYCLCLLIVSIFSKNIIATYMMIDNLARKQELCDDSEGKMSYR